MPKNYREFYAVNLLKRLIGFTLVIVLWVNMAWTVVTWLCVHYSSFFYLANQISYITYLWKHLLYTYNKNTVDQPNKKNYSDFVGSVYKQNTI